MLVYKAAQVLASQPYVEKPWDMADDADPTKRRTGVSKYSDVTVISPNGSVATIRLKGKDENEVKLKVSKLTLGKPAEIEVKAIKSSTRGVLVLEG